MGQHDPPMLPNSFIKCRRQSDNICTTVCLKSMLKANLYSSYSIGRKPAHRHTDPLQHAVLLYDWWIPTQFQTIQWSDTDPTDCACISIKFWNFISRHCFICRYVRKWEWENENEKSSLSTIGWQKKNHSLFVNKVLCLLATWTKW